MELKEAKYMDNLLRRANRSVINIDNVDGESIDMLIDRDLIEVVDKRHGVDPYFIKISPRGRDFLANGGFQGKDIQEKKIKAKEKIEKRNINLDNINKILSILAAIATIVSVLLLIF